LLSGKEESDLKKKLDDNQRMLMDDLNLSTQDLSSSIFTGEEELFAFQRAVSRLVEMQGLPWLGEQLKQILSGQSQSPGNESMDRR
jgi:hypothetical protein